ncbi:MAG: universal stress protein [Methanocellales archaeon]|nr:universal stress protein [Methanocellales archaeon]
MDKRTKAPRQWTLLAATAGPEPASRKVNLIIDIAKQLNARLVVLYVILALGSVPPSYWVEDGRKAIEIFKQAGKRESVDVRGVLVESEHIDSAILSTAEDVGANMIILGVGRHSVLRHLLGGDFIEHIIYRSQRPVIIIPTL